MKILTSFMIILLVATIAFSAGPNDILGIWKTEGDESKVEIHRCGEKICGTIIWLKNPIYTDSRDGAVGTPVIDRKNPDPALKSRPVLGLRLLEGFSAEDDNTWGNGSCYDEKWQDLPGQNPSDSSRPAGAERLYRYSPFWTLLNLDPLDITFSPLLHKRNRFNH